MSTWTSSRSGAQSVEVPRRVAPAALATVLLLAGCAGCAGPRAAMPGPSTAPSSSPSSSVPPGRSGPVAALFGGFWRVERAGEPPSTRVRFGPRSAVVFRARGRIDGPLAFRDDRLLWELDGWSSALGTRPPDVPWLADAARVHRDGDVWRVDDVDGREVAALVRADPPRPSSQYETAPTPLDGEAGPRAVLPPAAGGGDVAGTWRVPGLSAVALHLGTDGRWTARTSCATGTGAAGGAGRWRVLPDGALLVVEGGIAGVGCSDSPTPPPAAAAVTDFWEAGSVSVVGHRLTVFDRAGAPLGVLDRE